MARSITLHRSRFTRPPSDVSLERPRKLVRVFSGGTRSAVRRQVDGAGLRERGWANAERSATRRDSGGESFAVAPARLSVLHLHASPADSPYLDLKMAGVDFRSFDPFADPYVERVAARCQHEGCFQIQRDGCAALPRWLADLPTILWIYLYRPWCRDMDQG